MATRVSSAPHNWQPCTTASPSGAWSGAADLTSMRAPQQGHGTTKFGLMAGVAVRRFMRHSVHPWTQYSRGGTRASQEFLCGAHKIGRAVGVVPEGVTNFMAARLTAIG